MTSEAYTITDNLGALLDILPADLKDAIPAEDRGQLLEIVLDLGRRPEARFSARFKYLRDEVVSREELDFVEARLGAFGDDNRAGLPATLHRISAIKNRRGIIVGLTLRVGRAVSGIVDILRDLIEGEKSLLVMGRPGLGKTTLLREMARVLADDLGKRVVIVDTSNEIAGDGDIPHPAIGRARRMQVAKVAAQHDVMIEAVENHMPEVIIIDEIGHAEEALASRTIAERGVQLIATVHGNTLENLIANPTMSDLVGGIQAVTLSDEEARRRGTQKTVLERKSPPTFDVIIEMISRNEMAVRRPVRDVVDAILRGQETPPELRLRREDGEIEIQEAPELIEPAPPTRSERFLPQRSASSDGSRGRSEKRTRTSKQEKKSPSQKYSLSLSHNGTHSAERLEAEPETESEETENKSSASLLHTPIDVSRVRTLFPFGVSRSRLMRAIKQLGLPLDIVRRWQEADAVLMLLPSGATSLGDAPFLREAQELGLPIIGVQGNTYAQIASRLNALYSEASDTSSPRDLASKEAYDAAQRVLSSAMPAELRAQAKAQRQIQHKIADKFHLRSYSVGASPIVAFAFCLVLRAKPLL